MRTCAWLQISNLLWIPNKESELLNIYSDGTAIWESEKPVF